MSGKFLKDREDFKDAGMSFLGEENVKNSHTGYQLGVGDDLYEFFGGFSGVGRKG